MAVAGPSNQSQHCPAVTTSPTFTTHFGWLATFPSPMCAYIETRLFECAIQTQASGRMPRQTLQ